jgi:hypothetical protein
MAAKKRKRSKTEVTAFAAKVLKRLNVIEDKLWKQGPSNPVDSAKIRAIENKIDRLLKAHK